VSALPTTRRAVLLGGLVGIGILLRQTMLLFAPVLWLWLWWQSRRQIQWWQYAMIVLIPMSMILPFTIRNYSIYGRILLLNSNGGYVLYASNHPNTGYDWTPANAVNPVPE